MIISVRVKPGSKKPGIEFAADNSLVIKVAARPVEGKANTAVIRALADALKIPQSKVKLVSGETAKIKRFEIPEMPDLREKILKML